MFSMLVTCYLFFGGAGAGTLVVLCVLEGVRAFPQPGLSFNGNVEGARMVRPWVPGRRVVEMQSMRRLPDELYERAWPLCFVLIAAGMLCLMADVGRPDRVLNLLVSPHLSAMTVGAYALVAALALSAAFSARALLFSADSVPFRYFPLVGVPLGVVAGLVVAVYTGVLLQSLASVLFWQTALLPLVFAASSLSCGIACVLGAAAFSDARLPFALELSRLANADTVVITFEAVCLAAMLATSILTQEGQLCAAALISGDLRWEFWGGVVVCGIVVPVVLERFVTHGNFHNQCIWIAAFVLVGGFALRYCMVQAGMYDVTHMPSLLYGLTGLTG